MNEMYSIYLVLFIAVFLVGISIGSFINLLIIRLHDNESIFKKSSHCDYCGHKLGILDLIPLFSYFIIGGKCRYCKKPLTELYSFVELATGVLFVITFLKFFVAIDMFNLSSILPVIVVTMVVALVLSIFIFFAAYDILYMEVPDKYSIPLIVFFIIVNSVALLYSVIAQEDIYLLGILKIQPFFNLVLGVASSLFISSIIIITKGRGMGGGDIRIAALIGLLCGFKGTIMAFYISFIVGAVFGIGYALVKGKFKGVQIPFVPFLSLGAIFGFLYGDELFKIIFPLIGR